MSDNPEQNSNAEGKPPKPPEEPKKAAPEPPEKPKQAAPQPPPEEPKKAAPEPPEKPKPAAPESPPPEPPKSPPQSPPGPPPPQAAPGQEYVSPNRTIMFILAYLGILALIPLLVEKDDGEIQWHAKHGIILTVFWIVVSIVVNFIPGLGCLVSALLPLVILGVHIFLIVKAVNGERFKLPLISDFADQWK